MSESTSASEAAPLAAPAVTIERPTPELPARRLGGVGWFSARFAVIGVWLLLAVLFGALRPDTFLTEGTLRTIFGSQQALVFLTAGLLCTIIVGEFVDLSVASNF